MRPRGGRCGLAIQGVPGVWTWVNWAVIKPVDNIAKGLHGGNDCVESTVTLAAAELDSLRPAELKWGMSQANSQDVFAVYCPASS